MRHSKIDCRLTVQGQNPNASRMLACQLWPAADKPPHALYSAMCRQDRTHAPQQTATLGHYAAFDSDPRRISSSTELGYDAVARCPRGVRTARPQGADIKMPSPSIDHRKLRLCFTTVISATCVIGVGTAPAQAPGSVGSRCNVNSDCTSGVCHPVTHLCMISPGAARRPNASCDINSDCGSDGKQPRDKPTPKASGRPVGATCNVDSDCDSRVCHPVTRLCMMSPAAARP